MGKLRGEMRRMKETISHSGINEHVRVYYSHCECLEIRSFLSNTIILPLEEFPLLLTRFLERKAPDME